MPGPVSDSFDFEWTTSSNRAMIEEELRAVYKHLSHILGNKPPMYILELVQAKLPKKTFAKLTEKEWRLLRFAVERAIESL